MLPAVPIALTSGFMWLLALTSRVTLSQIYTASAVVYYGNQLARTTVEPVLLLPMPGYVQQDPEISADLAVFIALSPIGSPVGHASPTLGECVGAVSSAVTSFVRSGHSMTLRLLPLTPLFGSPTASALLTLEPHVSALGNSSAVANGSTRSAFGPLYLDFVLAAPLAPCTPHGISVPLKLGWCSRGPEDAHLTLADLVPVKPLALPNTCTPSSLGSCGLGDYSRRSGAARVPPTHLSSALAPPRLGWYAYVSKGAHEICSVFGKFTIVSHTHMLSGIGFCGISRNARQAIAAPPLDSNCGVYGGHDQDDSNAHSKLRLGVGVHAPSGLDSCRLGTQHFNHSPPPGCVARHPDWLNPDTVGSWLVVLFLVAVQFWIVYRLVDVAQTDLMVAAPGVVQAMNGAVYGCNRVLPATCPLDFFNPHLFNIGKPPLDPIRFFVPKLFQLPREVPAIDPMEFFVPNLFTLSRPAPNDLLDFFTPKLFRQPRPSDRSISCVVDPLELFTPELFTLDLFGLLPQIVIDLEELDRFIAEEKRWDEEMDAKLAELDAIFKHLDQQEEEGNKRLEKIWTLSDKRRAKKRGAKETKGMNKPEEKVGARAERRKEGEVTRKEEAKMQPKRDRDEVVVARQAKFEAGRRHGRGSNQGGGVGRGGSGGRVSRGQRNGSNDDQGVVGGTTASGRGWAVGEAMRGVGKTRGRK